MTVHGGPESQWRPWFAPSFLPLTQHLVARGYAVAAPNVRGSTGYGKRFELPNRIDCFTRAVAFLDRVLAA